MVFAQSGILPLLRNSPIRAAVLAAILRRALQSGLVSRSIFTAGRFRCLGEVPTYLKSGSCASSWGSLVFTQAPTRNLGDWQAGAGWTRNLEESANKIDHIIHYNARRANSWGKSSQKRFQYQGPRPVKASWGGGKGKNRTKQRGGERGWVGCEILSTCLGWRELSKKGSKDVAFMICL